MVRSITRRRRPSRSDELDALAGDADPDAFAAEPFPQFRYVVGLVGVQALGLEVPAAVGVVAETQ